MNLLDVQTFISALHSTMHKKGAPFRAISFAM